ncbi:alpha/beta hydrolase [Peribacillus saganii]|uniref:Alpha/beta hydrolase n=1 Tax=Peribacillus saganii TaxID=2303992 RepID=A0A372LMH2_9BACI|nr:alpha/beta hydrolase [Peribacillus saganii]
MKSPEWISPIINFPKVMVEYVKRFLDTWQLRKVHVAGVSMGSTVAQMLDIRDRGFQHGINNKTKFSIKKLV